MPAPSRILIVGGGIAGLALGRALQAQGLVPEIIERSPSWPCGGTGLYLPGNGIRALGALGLANKVLASATRMSHQRILNHRGRRLAEVELQKLWNGVGVCVGIARTELHRILLDGADRVPIRLGTTVTALTQEDDEVSVIFNDSSRGTYDLVVGADGIHSSIRRLVLAGVRPRHLGQVSWRFLLDRSGAVETWTAMLGPRQVFLALPVGLNRLYCYADLVTVGTDDPARGDLDRFVGLFKEFAHPVPSLLSSLESFDAIHFSPIEEIDLDTWVHGRVVLIGDAAHATSPNMAEGASMALEDALVLAQMLATYSSTNQALTAFSERRRPRVSWVRDRTHRRDRIRTLPVLIRNLALRLAWPVLYRRDYRPLLEQP